MYAMFEEKMVVCHQKLGINLKKYLPLDSNPGPSPDCHLQNLKKNFERHMRHYILLNY